MDSSAGTGLCRRRKKRDSRRSRARSAARPGRRLWRAGAGASPAWIEPKSCGKSNQGAWPLATIECMDSQDDSAVGG